MDQLKLNIGSLFFLNAVAMIGFMVMTSIFCETGLAGGEYVKRWDNRVFLLQVFVNIGYGGYYLNVINPKKWPVFIINLFLVILFYITGATFHSFLQE